jgi:hypothetical protein
MKSTLDIYQETRAIAFDNLFQSPSALFRGAPFWSWNTKLDPDQLCRQIDVMKKMGLGGFHMHSRTGMNTPYLSDEFMAMVKTCVEKAEREEMLAWLYDEDRWPSGSAGGLVTQDPKYCARHLLFTAKPYETESGKIGVNIEGAYADRTGNGRLLARYAIRLDADGALAGFRRLQEPEPAADDETVWFAYIETAEPCSWFNNQTYVDTLNPAAIEKFVEITHDRYKEGVGDWFGGIVPGIFTDEPQFTHKSPLAFAKRKQDIVMPFTEDFLDSYHKSYGDDLLDTLPEVFWELPDGRASVTRYRFHDHVAERFAAAFADTIGRWCETNGIVLTGHMMEEPTLESQTHALGDAMRSYRSFQLPGIDMLCDSHEYTTAKQAQSAAHQYGRGGVLSELYGVTGWDFDFAGHKCQGDWQAALGVTVRVHHLSWVSMQGEAKRDYPASILHQSPWWEKYAVVEDHFARVNVALTRGNPHVRVGMLHPVESFWLCYGPRDSTAVERDEREYTFGQVTKWLLSGLIDFDYICESLLPELNASEKIAQFKVGEMAYDTVLVPPMRTIRSSTLERLEAFVDGGGKLVFAGEIPSLVDVVPSDRAQRLAERAKTVEFTQSQILQALEDCREIEALCENGSRPTSLLYQTRDLGDARHLFVCNADRKQGLGTVTVRIRGEWSVETLDTATGATAPLAARQENGWTELDWTCHAHGHLLVRLAPGISNTVVTPTGSGICQGEELILNAPVPVTLSEPNVLLLDQAEWRFDNGDWQPREELLRLDDAVRATIGLAQRGGQMAQPWTEPEDDTVLGILDLRFKIDCETAVKSPQLAVEQPEWIELELDGATIQLQDNGWWVDECLRKLELPALDVGGHELLVRIKYRRKTNVEWCYLLGDFGVRVAGRDAVVTAPVRKLAFGDITRQGLPFYTGNLTYHCGFEIANSANLELRTSHFSGAMMTAKLDDGEIADIAFAPFATDLGQVASGSHRLDITLYGNRHNAFGALHWTQPGQWIGPDAWRTTGDDWCYEYKDIRPMGILAAPRLVS